MADEWLPKSGKIVAEAPTQVSTSDEWMPKTGKIVDAVQNDVLAQERPTPIIDKAFSKAGEIRKPESYGERVVNMLSNLPREVAPLTQDPFSGLGINQTVNNLGTDIGSQIKRNLMNTGDKDIIALDQPKIPLMGSPLDIVTNPLIVTGGIGGGETPAGKTLVDNAGARVKAVGSELGELGSDVADATKVAVGRTQDFLGKRIQPLKDELESTKLNVDETKKSLKDEKEQLKDALDKISSNPEEGELEAQIKGTEERKKAVADRAAEMASKKGKESWHDTRTALSEGFGNRVNPELEDMEIDPEDFSAMHEDVKAQLEKSGLKNTSAYADWVKFGEDTVGEKVDPDLQPDLLAMLKSAKSKNRNKTVDFKNAGVNWDRVKVSESGGNLAPKENEPLTGKDFFDKLKNDYSPSDKAHHGGLWDNPEDRARGIISEGGRGFLKDNSEVFRKASEDYAPRIENLRQLYKKFDVGNPAEFSHGAKFVKDTVNMPKGPQKKAYSDMLSMFAKEGYPEFNVPPAGDIAGKVERVNKAGESQLKALSDWLAERRESTTSQTAATKTASEARQSTMQSDITHGELSKDALKKALMDKEALRAHPALRRVGKYFALRELWNVIRGRL